MYRPGTRAVSAPASRQRGAIAIIVGLSLVVLIGMVGLAVDGGRLYLNKTELQNGADACALAAAYELTGSPIPAAAFSRAVAAANTIAAKNSADFQSSAIASVVVEFATSLTGPWTDSAGASGTSKYVRCTTERSGLTPYFMQVMGFGAQTVSARATASLAPAQTNCAVPMALCAKAGAPDYGYTVGQWEGMDFKEVGGSSNYTGNFRWIDFDPSSTTPGCPGNGAQELSCVLAGTGQCSVPAPITGSCSTTGAANPTPGCVGENGAINSIEGAFNSRFGIYKSGGYSATTAPPDFTGKSYSTENWAPGANALADFLAARTAHTPAANVAGVNPDFFKSPPYSASSSATHVTYGADRRLVVVPILDCGSFAGGQHAPVRAYACVLMLDPYRKSTGNNVTSRLEYRGLANAAGSPCATSGIAGSSTSPGPLVPSLVQ